MPLVWTRIAVFEENQQCIKLSL